MKNLKENIKKLPKKPGVYFFIGKGGKILYVGKATSLRDRVRSYFTGDIEDTRSKLIQEMVEKTKSVEYKVTDSVLEALILEAYEIRTHKPRYNTIGLDDKSFNYLVITNEKWPRLLTVREYDLDKKFTKKDIKYIFGPFPKGALFKEALRLIRKIFPYYDTKNPVEEMLSGRGRKKIEFNQQIGLYPGSETTEKDYKKTIQHIKLLFEGKKKKLLRELEKEMKGLAGAEKFEIASQIKKQIFALSHIQDVSLIGEDFKKRTMKTNTKSLRIESYDIAHIGGEAMVGVMVVLEEGEIKKNEYRKFKIKTVNGPNDTAALAEVLTRRLSHGEWQLPRMIVVDGGKAQTNVMERVLKNSGIEIPVLGVVKDDKHRPKEIIGSKELKIKFEKEILLANSEAHRFAINYHRQVKRKEQL
jgi:excinuclease ABC subunit C